ncbi:ROK family transcriptional regulator [Lipingzhangella sp. LS1_29]|uniref:ROK family transcriptional regulator n=1 Tax=Lipingzhangella rawalii TaxID=2055835 RepID=A0ABU2H0M2_9ACTN|nr:ROK family transcriptional regulator [Lipingzhangella rawalii]MDS1268851.1 ROK family transcriptional regulator [Lipingzhangella rawalii]
MTRYSTAQRAIRASNLGQVLGVVRRRAPCSRAEVASELGLTRATVSSLVAELTSHGLVREEGTSTTGKVGRPGQMLRLDDRFVAALGVEVNVDYLTLVAVDLMGGELLHRHVTFDTRSSGPHQTLARLAEVIASGMSEPGLARRRVLGVGVAVPALVDDAGTVRRAPNLGWSDVPLAAELRNASGSCSQLAEAPILVHNDASLAVVAEYRDGHLAGTQDLVYLTGEVGIGAGILRGGHLLQGAHGYAGEIGHIAMQPDGPRCACGRQGCLEALAGIEAILRRAVPDRVRTTDPLAARELAGAVHEAVRRAQSGDADVVAVLDEAGHWLGNAAAHVCNLLDTEAIILGGYFVPLGPWLLPAANDRLRSGVFAAQHHDTRIHLSTLGLTAAARGGASMPVQSLERGQIPVPATEPA